MSIAYADHPTSSRSWLDEWIPPGRQLKAGNPIEMDEEAFRSWLRLMKLTAVIVRGEMKRWE